jgi:hypothetical protein
MRPLVAASTDQRLSPKTEPAGHEVVRIVQRTVIFEPEATKARSGRLEKGTQME